MTTIGIEVPDLLRAVGNGDPPLGALDSGVAVEQARATRTPLGDGAQRRARRCGRPATPR